MDSQTKVPIIPILFKRPTKDYDSIRNDVLEEAAHLLEMQAGEGFNNGNTFHYCANEIRKLKSK